MMCKKKIPLVLEVLWFVILSASCKFVFSCTYQEYYCDETNGETIIQLSGIRTPSCIKWHTIEGINNDPCVMLLKTENDAVELILLEFESVKGEIEIANATNNGNGLEIKITQGSSNLVYTLASNLLRLSWSDSGANETIVARFEELVFQQYPVSHRRENNGKYSFLTENNTYTLNSAYILVLSNEDITNSLNVTSMDIEVEKASLSKENGDVLIIGMGNETQILNGPKSLLLTTSIKQPLHVHLTNGEAFLILMTGRNKRNKSSDFVVNWNRMISGSIQTTEEPVTPLLDTWQQAISLCIKGKNKDDFKNNHTLFLAKVAEVATSYAEYNKIVLSSVPIRPNQVHISMEYIFGFGENDLEGTNIILTIVEKYDETKATFRSKQLKDLFESPKELADLKYAGFEIIACEGNPDYWNWFWAACTAFLLSLTIILIIWYIRQKNLFTKKDKDDIDELMKHEEERVTPYHVTANNARVQRNYLRVTSQNLTRDDIADKNAEINTNVAVRIRRDLGNHVQTSPFKSSIKRQASAPIQLTKVIKASTDSPKSILKNRSRPFSLPQMTIETKNDDENHIYERLNLPSVTLTDAVNEETQESKL